MNTITMKSTPPDGGARLEGQVQRQGREDSFEPQPDAARGLRVKTNVKAGTAAIAANHNQTLVRKAA